MTKPTVSIVVPAFSEAENVAVLHAEVKRAMESGEHTWELILVDDGSKDTTWQEITKLHAQDERVRGLRLSRNFGHQYALFAGLRSARGDAVISMDADLQHPPEVLSRLLDEWSGGAKLVHTVRTDPASTGAFKRLTSRLYYRLYSFLSGVKLESGMADFRLLDRQVLNHLLEFREEGLFLRGLVQWVGFESAKVHYVAQARRAGQSKYTARKMLRLAWTGITSFSVVPLRVGIGVGVITSGISFFGIVYAMYSHLSPDVETVPGWASVVAILSFLFGILFILLGVIGVYVGRVLIEVRSRPRFLIAETLGMDDHDPHGTV
ncbi:MAG: glycosyltransferase family 2 protein [Planctomycetota bacterium]